MSQTKDKSTARHALTLCTQETHISTRTVLSERLLLPVKIFSALSKQTCHSAGHAQLFLATNWTQQLLWGHGELHGLFFWKREQPSAKTDTSPNQPWHGVHQNLLRGLRMLLLASSLFSVSDLSETFSVNLSFLSLWLAFRRWRRRRR